MQGVPPSVNPRTGLRPHFSVCRRAGDLMFVSGQMALGPAFDIVGKDVGEQTRTCLTYIGDHLKTVGLSLNDVAKTTVWLTRVEDFPAFNDAYKAFFDGGPLPARSTVRADLMIPGALVEIEAIALCKDTAP